VIFSNEFLSLTGVFKRFSTIPLIRTIITNELLMEFFKLSTREGLMRKGTFGSRIVALGLLFGFLATSLRAAVPDTGWAQVWSDECNGAAGSAVDGTKWNMVNSGGGFGNGELQFYSNRTANSYYDGAGNLVIKTMRESLSGSNYTSAKLFSRNKGDWTYCKVVVRAKLPKGRCVWPAFWMMPTNSKYGGWPACGEIDIMEERGDRPGSVGSTIHFGNPWKYMGQSYTLPRSQTFDTAYHLFGMIWEAGKFRFFVDTTFFETRVASEWYTSGASKTTAPNAPFDQNFYMQLNTAVGGPNTPYTGNQNPDDAVFPQYMYIDYVRIFKPGKAAVTSPTQLHRSETFAELSLSARWFAPATLRLALGNEAAAGKLSIYTMRGERVKTFDFAAGKSSCARIGWDGRSESGRVMGQGTYVVSATGGGMNASGLIVLDHERLTLGR
jgi:beta-glucanase (GH16 family)